MLMILNSKTCCQLLNRRRYLLCIALSIVVNLDVLIPYMKSIICSYYFDPWAEYHGLMMILMKQRFYLGLVDKFLLIRIYLSESSIELVLA